MEMAGILLTPVHLEFLLFIIMEQQQYSDENGNQNGNWYSDYISSGYYDLYGNYYNDYHNDFQIKVSDNRGNYINLYFDFIAFSGNNRFSATYYDGKNIREYNFYRY